MDTSSDHTLPPDDEAPLTSNSPPPPTDFKSSSGSSKANEAEDEDKEADSEAEEEWTVPWSDVAETTQVGDSSFSVGIECDEPSDASEEKPSETASSSGGSLDLKHVTPSGASAASTDSAAGGSVAAVSSSSSDASRSSAPPPISPPPDEQATIRLLHPLQRHKGYALHAAEYEFFPFFNWHSISMITHAIVHRVSELKWSALILVRVVQ
jgi:hypothetical protein